VRAEGARVPFTLAHPAAVLPLRSARYLRTAPLIIGAMAPDVPYFLPGSLGRFMPDTHEFEGSYTTDLVLGYILLSGIFILRRPLTALLSPRARWLCLNALAPLRQHWSAWALAALGLIVGIWSHLLWDSFTHMDGWTVRRVAALSAPVSFGPYTEQLCHVLQYVSSVFGLLVMVIWYWRLPAPAALPAEPGAARSAARPILVLVAAAGLLIGGVQATAYFHRTHVVYKTINILLTHSLTWFAVLYLVAGIIITLEHKAAAAGATLRA
jgi:uncharacterized protein DUF4184